MDLPGVRDDEAGYKFLFEASLDGMILLSGGDRRILDANPSARRMLGREDLIGMPLDGICDPSYPILDAAWERLREADSFYVTARLRRGDGSSFPAGITVSGADESGRIGLIFREAGQSPQAEQAEDACSSPVSSGMSATEYRAMVEGAMDAMLVANLDNTFRYVNPALARIMGYEPEEMVGMFTPDIIHPEDLARAARANAGIQNETGMTGPYEIRYRRKDGSWIHLETTLNNLADDPEVLGVVAVCRDVTDRKRAEERLKESERWFRTLIRSAPDMIFVLEEDGAIRYASPSVGRTLGYDLEREFVGMNVQDFLHPEDIEEAGRVVEATRGDPAAIGVAGPHVRVRHRDGSWRVIEGFLTNLLDDPDVRGLVFNSRDVTEKVEAEGRLREREERFRGLVENAHDFVALADENNVALYANASIERIMGYTPEEFVGTVIAGYIHPEDAEASIKQVMESMAIPGPHRLQTLRYRHKDGSYRWLEVVVNNRLDDPALGGVVCNCRDVTERVEAEKALRESEERHRALNENALDLVLIQAPDSTISYASPSMKRLLGYDPEEELGKGPADFIHPDDLEWAWPVFHKQLQTPGVHEGVNIRYRHKDGRWRWFESHCNNQLANPAVNGLIFNCRDVTERVEAENKLRESEEWHRALNEHAADLIVVQNPDATVSYVSPSVERILGYTPEEFIAVGVPEIIHPEDLQGAWEALGEVVENPGAIRSKTLRYRHADGAWRVLETVCNSRMDDSVVHGLVFNCRDVTERVEAEEKLREAEERYRLLVEQVPAATYIERNDVDSSTVYVSPQIQTLLGYAPEEWMSDPGMWLRTLHPEDQGRVMARHLRCNETGEPFDEEYRCFSKDGREVWVRDEAALVRDEAGEPLYWQGVKVDITGRKLAELEILRLNTELRGQITGYTDELKAAIESLKESERYLAEREEQYHATFEKAAVGIAHVSPEGRWVRVNGKLCETLGYPREELLKRTFQDITHPDDLDADLDRMESLLSGEIGSYSMEKRYFRKGGSLVWANLTVSLVRGPSGDAAYLISVIEDITRRKGAEALLKTLSPGEVEILEQMSQGRTNADIARATNLSAHTIKTRIKTITEKLGAVDRTQAAVYAVEMGLFTPEFKIPDTLPRVS